MIHDYETCTKYQVRKPSETPTFQTFESSMKRGENGYDIVQHLDDGERLTILVGLSEDHAAAVVNDAFSYYPCGCYINEKVRLDDGTFIRGEYGNWVRYSHVDALYIEFDQGAGKWKAAALLHNGSSLLLSSHDTESEADAAIYNPTFGRIAPDPSESVLLTVSAAESNSPAEGYSDSRSG